MTTKKKTKKAPRKERIADMLDLMNRAQVRCEMAAGSGGKAAQEQAAKAGRELAKARGLAEGLLR